MKIVNKKTTISALFILLSLGVFKFIKDKQFSMTCSLENKEPQKAKTDNTDNNDTVNFDSLPIPTKKPQIKFSRLNQSIYMEFEGFSYAVPGNTKLVWSPLVILKPSITINNKFSLGFTTTQMMQNYTTQNMTAIIHNMYIQARLTANKNNYFVNIGQWQALNYAGPFAKHMPISYFFQNAMLLHSGHTLPSAIMIGMSNNKFSISAGYTEYGKPFQFSGHGDFIAIGEVCFNTLKIGTLWTLNNDKCIGDLQVVYNPNTKNDILLEVIGINSSEFGIHAIYAYNITNEATIFLNGYKQFNDGISGANIGVKHKTSGVYLAVGGTYHDNLLQETPLYDKMTPMLELGITKDLPSLITQNKTR